jgi:hypothetical protein
MYPLKYSILYAHLHQYIHKLRAFSSYFSYLKDMKNTAVAAAAAAGIYIYLLFCVLAGLLYLLIQACLLQCRFKYAQHLLAS